MAGFDTYLYLVDSSFNFRVTPLTIAEAEVAMLIEPEGN